MLRALARELIAHAAPIFVAQLSSIGMMVVDTVVLGHVSATDLAAVAIGGGIHVSIVFALVGIVQAIGPVAAHLHGAGRERDVANILQQGFWLSLVLSLPGVVFLLHPEVLLQFSTMDAEVEGKVRLYLALQAWGLPAALCYRAFYAFCNALGRPRVLMMIGLVALLLHAFLAWGLALQAWFDLSPGIGGCALSNVLIAWLACGGAALYLAIGPLAERYPLFADWSWPRRQDWFDLLRLGLPMGFSNLVEITAFTLVSLFIASLGASVVAGHRIVANLAALCYMLPLSLAIATQAQVAQAVGARNWQRAHAAIRGGLLLAGGLSTFVGILIWLAADSLVSIYTDDWQVRHVAVGLAVYIAIYQFFDAVQTVAGHALRAFRVTFVPMLIQTFCFWGIGLLGGWWLCYRGPEMGVGGFWLASVLSLVFAAFLLLPLLRKIIKATECTL